MIFIAIFIAQFILSSMSTFRTVAIRYDRRFKASVFDFFSALIGMGILNGLIIADDKFVYVIVCASARFCATYFTMWFESYLYERNSDG